MFVSRFLWLLLLFLVSVSNIAATSRNEEEKQTLLHIKIQWGNPQALHSWSNSTSSVPHCNWNGINCAVDGYVTAISLSNVGLSDAIPSEICNLKNLLHLDLYNNSISGNFPSYLYNCSKLQYLNLSLNYFAGFLPDDIYHMSSSLIHLDLSFNNFAGDIPSSIGKLAAIKYLYLNDNNFNGSFPQEIGNLTTLQQLWLANNPFVPAAIPREFGNLTKLTFLWISNASLTGEIPDTVQKLHELEWLDFSSNFLSGEIPPSIWKLKKLQKLYLYANKLNGEIRGSIDAVNLTDIDVSMNHLTGPIPDAVGQLQSLRILFLYYNKLSGEIPAGIGTLPSLYDLRIFNNNLTGILPPELGMHSMLWNFEADDNLLTGELPKGLCANKALTDIVVFNNMLTGKIPASIGDCPALDDLQIYNNKFSGEFPSAIWSYENLTTVLIHDNNLSGTLPDRLQPKLSRLEMWNNEFYGRIPSHAPGLRVFRANNNRFSDELPESFAALSQLENLELHGNKILGKIPESISSLQRLQELDLSDNNLTGQIPGSIGSLQLLNYLDLSVNEFSGIIPPEMGSLKLNMLNLSKNHLSGEVPLSFQNQAYDDSFVDNPGLCSSAELQGIKNCSTQQDRRHRYLYFQLIILSSVAAVLSLMACVGCFMLRRRKNVAAVDGWSFTKFQALDFNEDGIVHKLNDENLIGKGGAGKVYRVDINDNSSTKAVAVKKIHSSRKLNEKLLKEFEAEVSVLGSIKHSNIVKLLCCISNTELKLLVYEFMENGSLDQMLHRTKKNSATSQPLDWPTRLSIAVGAARGLCYMHHDCSAPVIHRDIKSSNILLDSEFNAKVADFGLARILVRAGEADSVTAVAGSFGYLAPEYVSTKKVNEKVDVYSFGVVLLELVTGKEARGGDVDSGLADWALQQYQYGTPIYEAVDEEIRDLSYLKEIEAVYMLGLFCTNKSPSGRPTMKQVLEVLLRCEQALQDEEESFNGECDVDVLLHDKKGSRRKKSCDTDTDGEEEESLVHLV